MRRGTLPAAIFFCFAATPVGRVGGGEKVDEEFLGRERGGGGRRFVTGCFRKCKKGNLFIIGRAVKLSQPFKAVYFCLPKVKFKTAHAGKMKQKVRLQPLALEKRRVKLFLQSRKEEEFWLLVYTRGENTETQQGTKNAQPLFFSPVYAEENKKKENSNCKKKKS